MKSLKLYNSELETLVDDDDYERLKDFRWIKRGIYVGRVKYIDGKQHTYLLHREVMIAGPKDLVDHKNHNTLDNRKSNLRICNRKQNARNSKRAKNNSSGFKGVGFHKARNLWRAYITIDLKTIHLGTFENIKDAARAYNEKALEVFGEFAFLNKIED